MVGPQTAGQLLRDARTRAGLSQTELARRAGVNQSVISVYESGRRQPSMATLVSLVSAAGATLDIRLLPGTGTTVQELPERVRVHARRIEEEAAAHGVRVLGVFGSVARGDCGPDSDVDLLLEVPAGVGLLALGRLEENLRQLLRADVDLVPEVGLKPTVRDRVMAELVPLERNG